MAPLAKVGDDFICTAFHQHKTIEYVRDVDAGPRLQTSAPMWKRAHVQRLTISSCKVLLPKTWPPWLTARPAVPSAWAVDKTGMNDAANVLKPRSYKKLQQSSPATRKMVKNQPNHLSRTRSVHWLHPEYCRQRSSATTRSRSSRADGPRTKRQSDIFIHLIRLAAFIVQYWYKSNSYKGN